MTVENEKDLTDTVDKVLSHAGDLAAQRIALSASLRLFHSKGYRDGYNDAMHDAKAGKDKRVVAHLNWIDMAG